MRAVISLLVFFLSFNIVQAQEESSHIKFMGIPMDCDVETFANRLEKEKGLKRVEMPVAQTILQGSFAGYSPCTIILIGNPNFVSSVGVTFPHHERWTLVYSNYTSIKNSLVSKYGEPVSSEESFGKYEPRSDIPKMMLIKEGNAKFQTIFLVEGGVISLRICAVENYEGYVELAYFDSENESINSRSITDDL